MESSVAAGDPVRKGGGKTVDVQIRLTPRDGVLAIHLKGM